jgi:hypothetical protein
VAVTYAAMVHSSIPANSLAPLIANFELWLKNRDNESGIHDFEAIEILANAQQLHLVTDISMPANNQLLVWKNPNNIKFSYRSLTFAVNTGKPADSYLPLHIVYQ